MTEESLVCVAGGIVGVRDEILAAEPLITRDEAAKNTAKKSSSPFSSRVCRLLLAALLSKRYSVRLQYRQLRRLKNHEPG